MKGLIKIFRGVTLISKIITITIAALISVTNCFENSSTLKKLLSF